LHRKRSVIDGSAQAFGQSPQYGFFFTFCAKSEALCLVYAGQSLHTIELNRINKPIIHSYSVGDEKCM